MYVHLIDFVAQSELAMLVVMSLHNTACEELLDTFGCDSRVEPPVLYLTAMLFTFILIVDTVGVCAILEDSSYNMAEATMACKFMSSVDSKAVAP